MAGRKANLLETKTLTLSVAPELIEDLEALVITARGRYGKGAAEAAERLLSERMNELVEKGVLLPTPKPQARRRRRT